MPVSFVIVVICDLQVFTALCLKTESFDIWLCNFTETSRLTNICSTEVWYYLFTRLLIILKKVDVGHIYTMNFSLESRMS